MESKEFDVVQRRSDRHIIVHTHSTGELKFVKLLRYNGLDRVKELIPELFTGRILSEVGLSKLNPQVEGFEGKPVIVMGYCHDLHSPVPVSLEKVNIADREYFAAALFAVDRLVKNTNRSRGRLEHVGWVDVGDGSIKLCPLDNGHTFGHGNENMEDDSDLANLVYSDHFSSEIVAVLPLLQQVEQVTQRLAELDFDAIGREIESNVCNTLLPTDEEKNFINQYTGRAITMLNRRRPILIEALRRTVNTALPVEPPKVEAAVG